VVEELTSATRFCTQVGVTRADVKACQLRFMATKTLEGKSRYIKDKKVGEGTYAVVYAGHDAQTKRPIAIKKIKIGQFRDGMDMSAIREVKFLQELKHSNVIELIDVFSSKTNLNLILEYLDSDLEMLIKDRTIRFQTSDVKSWILMTFRGLLHCHQNFILHRDLKPNNLLISANGTLKIADFGLARDYGDPRRAMSSQVVTIWYRAPELLFGSKSYGVAIDIWAVGCILAELLIRTPFFPGNNDLDQLDKIFQALGTPTDKSWPDVKALPNFVDFKSYPGFPLTNTFTASRNDELELLAALLSLDPRKRPDCMHSLQFPYFTNTPRPSNPVDLPRKGGGMDKVADNLKRKADSPANFNGPARRLVF